MGRTTTKWRTIPGAAAYARCLSKKGILAPWWACEVLSSLKPKTHASTQEARCPSFARARGDSENHQQIFGGKASKSVLACGRVLAQVEGFERTAEKVAQNCEAATSNWTVRGLAGWEAEHAQDQLFTCTDLEWKSPTRDQTLLASGGRRRMCERVRDDRNRVGSPAAGLHVHSSAMKPQCHAIAGHRPRHERSGRDRKAEQSRPLPQRWIVPGPCLQVEERPQPHVEEAPCFQKRVDCASWCHLQEPPSLERREVGAQR